MEIWKKMWVGVFSEHSVYMMVIAVYSIGWDDQLSEAANVRYLALGVERGLYQ